MRRLRSCEHFVFEQRSFVEALRIPGMLLCYDLLVSEKYSWPVQLPALLKKIGEYCEI